MIQWIESQPTALIFPLGFGLCYGLAAVAFMLVSLLSNSGLGGELKATTPVMLTPLSVVAGLVIAFLASRVWANIDHANAHVAHEASALREIAFVSNQLPVRVGQVIRGSLRTYQQFVDKEDWPAMTAGKASLKQAPPGLTDAMATLLSFVPADAGQQLVQQRAVAAVEQALDARRERLLLSKASLDPTQWIVIFILDLLILVTISMIHVDRRATTAVNLIIFSSALAACLVLLMVNDRPFAAGGNTVMPTPIEEVGID